MNLKTLAQNALDESTADWQESYGTPDPYRGIEEWVMYADDANFISACSPSRVLEMISHIEELEATIQRVRDLAARLEGSDHPLGKFIATDIQHALEALGDTQ